MPANSFTAAAFRALAMLSPEAEITLEANPGTVEADKFAGFRAAGVNRLSLGIQSFNEAHLKAHRPSHVLILPWNLKEEVMAQLAYIREWGGKFVVPMPSLAVFD